MISGQPKLNNEPQMIKCVVWDLDNTLWQGTLLEDRQVVLKKEIPPILQGLDKRGILLSIASRNDYAQAKVQLEAFGLWDYFLYPQIGWLPKSCSIQEISACLNIAPETIAFVDDQIFEREEVAFKYPEVLCIDAVQIDRILEMPQMIPKFITEESAIRRRLYQDDIVRKEVKNDFNGSDDSFLAALGLEFEICRADEKELQRAEELTVRTHQLNTTGYTYSYDELDAFRRSDDHLLLIARLKDKYGPYGTIGLALVEKKAKFWIIKLLLMSCRVMSRGVGTVMMSHIMHRAKEAGVRLRAEFLANSVNRMMLVTYKLGGFKEVEQKDNLTIFEHDLSELPQIPSHVKLAVHD